MIKYKRYLLSVLTLYLVHQQTPPGWGGLLFLCCAEFQPTDPPQCQLSPASRPVMRFLEVLIKRGEANGVNACMCIYGKTPFSFECSIDLLVSDLGYSTNTKSTMI